MICKEALIWKQLQHPNVLSFLGVDADTFPGYLCMVSPWMPNGTILEHIKNTDPSGTEMMRYVCRRSTIEPRVTDLPDPRFQKLRGVQNTSIHGKSFTETCVV
jgi:hypothetical protein